MTGSSRGMTGSCNSTAVDVKPVEIRMRKVAGKEGADADDGEGHGDARFGDDTFQASAGRRRGGYGDVEDKSLWMRFRLPLLGEMRFNPIVSTLAIAVIWTFVIICIVYQKEVPFVAWRQWIVEKFTWLYIGSQDIWFVFLVYLYFSKYSDVKLGKDTDKPEYGDATWFMMLFACGIGVGLFFFGVAEPVFHYAFSNRYYADHTLPDNTLAQIAINVTLYHWGVHGWIVYSLVGLLLALLTYREGLPMTMKSCFYPLIGDRVFGWVGDLIDVISIMTTLFGVCTSLGLGAKQLNTGLTILNSDIQEDDVTVQVIIIWCITLVATISTVSGVGMGIRRLSEICFMVGMLIMVVALLMDNTFYLLNLFVQSIGFYIQWLIQLGFHTDTFEQLGPSYGWEKRDRWLPDDVKNNEDPAKRFADGPESWMDSWTMFYWGWWISWCPFVGMFIAKISRGRTIKQFINGTMTAPVFYSFIWLIIFGGAGIRQEREAGKFDLCCKDSKNWFLNTSWTKDAFIQRGINFDDTVVASSSYWLCNGTECGECATTVLNRKETDNFTYGQMLDEYTKLGNDFGSTLGDRSVSRLSCHQTEQMWFDVMRSYSDIGDFLAVFSLIGIVLYFVTSSDSGSLVIDCLSANGDPDPPRLQRVFWAIMEGATATALLVAGGKDGLSALQTAGLLSGLPYTFLVCLICTSIWRAVKVGAGDLDPHGPDFAISIFDPFFAHPWREIFTHRKRSFELFLGFVKNVFMAPQTVSDVYKRLHGGSGTQIFILVAAWVMFVLFVLLHVLQLTFDGAWAFGWFFYFCFACIMTGVRLQVRDRLEIVAGNIWEDFFASLIFYPCCALQIDLTTREMKEKNEDGDEDAKDAERGNGKAVEDTSEAANGKGGIDNTAYSEEEERSNL